MWERKEKLIRPKEQKENKGKREENQPAMVQKKTMVDQKGTTSNPRKLREMIERTLGAGSLIKEEKKMKIFRKI